MHFAKEIIDNLPAVANQLHVGAFLAECHLQMHMNIHDARASCTYLHSRLLSVPSFYCDTTGCFQQQPSIEFPPEDIKLGTSSSVGQEMRSLSANGIIH